MIFIASFPPAKLAKLAKKSRCWLLRLEDQTRRSVAHGSYRENANIQLIRRDQKNFQNTDQSAWVGSVASCELTYRLRLTA
jgi:hypothetical protein